MTALTVESPRLIFGGRAARLQVEAAANPFAGSALSIAPDGYVHELVAGEPFAGFCAITIQTKDAAASDGDRMVDVIAGLFIAQLAISGAAQDDVAHGRYVYASDDNTFTFTAAGNTLVGQIVGLTASGIALVACRTWGEVGSGSGKIYSLSAAETLTAEHLDSVIFGDTQSAGFTLTLPPAADCTGRSMTFVRAGTGTNALTLDGNASETIDGGATLATMDSARDTVTIVSDGSNWYITAARLA